MMNSRTIVESLSSSDLRSATHKLVRRSHGLDAELLVHLGEIDERKLYLDWTFSSMFAFCVGELRFSEDVACNRIDLARAARRMPVILEALRSGQVHLACHDKFRKAQDLATIVEKALELLIEQVQKDRFATGRMYGREFMERARASVEQPEPGLRPGEWSYPPRGGTRCVNACTPAALEALKLRVSDGACYYRDVSQRSGTLLL